MNDFCKKIVDEYSTCYLFEKNKQVDIFLPEGFNIKKIKLPINHVSSNKEIYNNVLHVLNNEGILKNDKIYLNESGYIYLITKIIDDFIININIVPKMISLCNSDEMSYDNLTIMNNFFYDLYNVLNTYKTHTKDIKTFNKSSAKKLDMVEFETDLKILKKIYSIINSQLINKEEIKKLILTDMEVGEIDYEALKSVLEKGLYPQTVVIKNDATLKSIIFSSIMHKYNVELCQFLKNNQKNDIIKNLFNVVNKIKNHNYFATHHMVHYTLPELKKLLDKNEKIFKKNKELAIQLINLNANHIDINKTHNYKKKTIKVEKVWEKFIENTLNKKFTQISFQGIKKLSSNQKNQVYFSNNKYDSESEIDVIWKNYINIENTIYEYYNVADSKYKVFTGAPIPADIDKLKRDLDIHNLLTYKLKNGQINLNQYIEIKKNIKAYLLYPNIITLDISCKKSINIKVNEEDIDLFNENLNKIDFTNNLEFSDLNIYTKQINFIEITYY